LLKVDARGMSCPQPVLMTKNALEKNPKGVVVYVDNETAVMNIKRFTNLNGYKINVEEKDEDFVLEIVK
jgi:TusA-related sulfurtransferase